MYTPLLFQKKKYTFQHNCPTGLTLNKCTSGSVGVIMRKETSLYMCVIDGITHRWIAWCYVSMWWLSTVLSDQVIIMQGSNGNQPCRWISQVVTHVRLDDNHQLKSNNGNSNIPSDDRGRVRVQYDWYNKLFADTISNSFKWHICIWSAIFPKAH